MINSVSKIIGMALVLLLLSSCEYRDDLAPVVELHWREQNSTVIRHAVVRGETLYAIAFRYDKDYRQLAMLNHLSSPFTLRVGQILNLGPTRAVPFVDTPQPVVRHLPTKSGHVVRQQPVYSKTPPMTERGWQWPLRGNVVSRFMPQQGKKGIDIAAHRGSKIFAARAGVVAYAGSGLAGYGNLIIIKHDNQYLTAYGNNARNLVTVGQHIKSGQAIAEIGMVDRRYWGVHFEIRKTGKPVNPLIYLQRT